MTALAQRVFKTKWFAKAAKDAGIADYELCRAAQQLIDGQGDDLGGHVWKKRLSRNIRRSIVINKIGDCWIFVFLFAKADMENIDARELSAFRKLAKDYSKLTKTKVEEFLEAEKFVEICHA